MMMLKDLRRFGFENYYKPIGFTKEGKISGFFAKVILSLEKAKFDI